MHIEAVTALPAQLMNTAKLIQKMAGNIVYEGAVLCPKRSEVGCSVNKCFTAFFEVFYFMMLSVAKIV
jgi:hypothetical protein